MQIAKKLQAITVRWITLSYEEKNTIIIGSIIGAILIAYALIWLPVNNKIEGMKQTIAENKQIISWLQSSTAQITELQKKQLNPITPQTSVYSIIQKSAKEQPWGRYVTGIKQLDQNNVQLSFNSVDFDTLIKGIEILWQTQHINVIKIAVNRQNNLNLVQVNLILGRH